MAELKLTKQELRQQQIKLHQLQRYLPTLQLRKALLQAEVTNARAQQEELKQKHADAWKTLTRAAPLLSLNPHISLEKAASLAKVEKGSENIAGVDVPFLAACTFETYDYNLYDTPPWVDAFVEELRSFRSLAVKISVAGDRLSILERELREVYIRVNLFEKVKIPECSENIRRIRIYLGDQQASAVGRSKIAKKKIERMSLEAVLA